MSTEVNRHNTLISRVEDSWQELLELTVACSKDNLINAKLVQYELMSLRDKISVSKDGNDRAQLEACLKACQRLLTYYCVLRRQKQRAADTNLAFSRQALRRLHKPFISG